MNVASGSPFPNPSEIEGALARENATWFEFLQALHGLVHASCCGSGTGGAWAVRWAAKESRFATIGYAAWRESINPAQPLLPVRSGAYLLPDVTIVEPGLAPRAKVDLFVSKGRISKIVPNGSAPSDGAATVEALRGHVVCPALTDMHIHNPPSNLLNLTPLFLYLHLRHGIVRMREAGDVDGTGTPAALQLIESGALPGLDMHYCYAFVTTERARWKNSLHLDDPGQAEHVVQKLQHTGARWIKAYENLDQASLRALIDAATRAGLGVMGHVPVKLSFEEALIPDGQHFFGVPHPGDLRRGHVLNRIVDWQGVTRSRITETVTFCLRHGLAMTPTLSSSLALMRMRDYERERQAADVRMLPDLFGDIAWHPQHGLPIFRNMTEEDFRRGGEAIKLKLELTHALWSAGVPLRLGTDIGQPFSIPGSALHREISAFETAGVPRDAAWKIASLDAAKVLGRDDSGSLREGMRADFLTSTTSPLKEGWTPKSITAVAPGGNLMMASDLDAAIEREQSSFRGAIARMTSRWLAQFAITSYARRFVP